MPGKVSRLRLIASAMSFCGMAVGPPESNLTTYDPSFLLYSTYLEVL